MTEPYITNPSAIAGDSFALIRQELAAAGYRFAAPQADIIERIIHSTADFDFAETTRFSPQAVEAGIATLKNGGRIICDVNMIRVGISQPRVADLGGAIDCFVAEPVVRQRAGAAGTTRSAMGIRWAAEQGLIEGGLVVIGNAPTALFEAIKLINEGVRPALIVGVPVGFISTTESKAALTQVTAVPWITALGRKGGTPVAVAVVNALLRLAVDAKAEEVD
ncbi:MAG: precorrin-8X methylmutase [Anaerolineae bacterium]|nr:precorrin-8X methylmutase [Anaerolineae bacterium]